MRLLVGLGNPGRQYVLTRHNLGFAVVERLARDWKMSFQSSSLTKGFLAEGSVEGTDVALLMPTTYMNRSGEALRPVIESHKIVLSDVLVICDDIQLPFGQLRIRPKGSEGGHNGLKSIIETLGSNAFPRLRCGVGSPHPSVDAAEYVLEEFTDSEQTFLDDFLSQAGQCCRAWLNQDITKVMEQYNQRKEA